MKLKLLSKRIAIEHSCCQILFSFGGNVVIGLRSSFENLLRYTWDAVGCLLLDRLFLFTLLYLAIHLLLQALISKHILNRFVFIIQLALARLPVLYCWLEFLCFCESVLLKLLSYQFSASIDENLVLIFDR